MFKRHSVMASNKSLSAALMIAFHIGGLNFVYLSERFRIGVIFHRDMSASDRQISKYMALLLPYDQIVEKTWYYSGIIVWPRTFLVRTRWNRFCTM